MNAEQTAGVRVVRRRRLNGESAPDVRIWVRAGALGKVSAGRFPGADWEPWIPIPHGVMWVTEEFIFGSFFGPGPHGRLGTRRGGGIAGELLVTAERFPNITCDTWFGWSVGELSAARNRRE